MTIIDLSAPEPKDSTPTAGSNLAVTSGGVKTALDGKADSSDVYTKSQTDTKLADKVDASNFTTETWTFTLTDDTIVTKVVYLLPPTS